MSLLREAENSNGKVWPYDNLTPLESLSVGETIFLDLEIDCCKTSFAFTPTEVLPAKSNHTLGIARGIIFEKCLDGQYEHEVILTYGRPPTIHLYRSRLICP